MRSGNRQAYPIWPGSPQRNGRQLQPSGSRTTSDPGGHTTHLAAEASGSER